MPLYDTLDPVEIVIASEVPLVANGWRRSGEDVSKWLDMMRAKFR
ncbi:MULTISPECIES: hypothetical protein [unclassified Bradyrhizobium]|nr:MULTISPECIES: hypothetical protein [unclassified Bradyrhizobium]